MSSDIEHLPVAGALTGAEQTVLAQAATSVSATLTTILSWINAQATFLQLGSGAAAKTVQAKLQENVSVRDYGAKGDGVTDDTANITAADVYARSIGATLYFPAGTYMVSQLVLQTGSNWRGDGRNSTIIKLIAGSNKDVIYGVNSAACWGSTTPSGFANGFTLRNLTIDGNKASNSSGSGLAAFASRPILENIFIKNCAEYGMRTEYYDNAVGTDTFTMEGHFVNVRIDTVGKHGWWNNGPHDSVAVNVIIVDASQLTANTYDAFYLDNRSVTRHVSCHGWTRSTSVRARSALNVIAGSANSEFSGGCNFEGGYVANAIIAGMNCIFDSSTRFFAAWNGTNILLTGTGCTNNILKGKLMDPGSGRPACVGVQIGSAVGDYVSDNVIDVSTTAQENGNFVWSTNNTGGNNKITAKCYNATTATITGTPKVTDDVDIFINNSAGISHVNNRRQKTSLAIGSNASVTWTFAYPFAITPAVTFAPALPSGALTAGLWITAQGTTSVTIFNNNAQTATLNIVADAMN